MPRYTNTAIPNELARQIDAWVQEGRLGFRSRQEFVVDAVRRHLLYIRSSEEARLRLVQETRWTAPRPPPGP